MQTQFAFASSALLAAATSGAIPESDVPTNENVAKAYGGEYFNDGSDPQIRDMRCEMREPNQASCNYRVIREEGKFYNQCKGELVLQNSVWSFKLDGRTGAEIPYPTANFAQFCSPVYRSMAAPALAQRVKRPTPRSFQKSLYRPTGANHAIYHCPSKVRRMLCSPVDGEFSQYDCRYEDLGQLERKWEKRQTLVELGGRGWLYVSGDKPECSISWDPSAFEGYEPN